MGEWVEGGLPMKSAIKEILKEAGKIASREFYSKFKINDKSPGDHVTQADLEIEDFLKQQLSIIYPEAVFYGEEGGYSDSNGDHLFVMDPIDGTANFIFGVPFFSISLAEIKDETLNSAYVYNPLTDDLYHADREHPATLNDKPIHVSLRSTLEESFISLGFSAHKENMERYLMEWPEVFKSVRKALPLLSPSMNLCQVAAGKIDGFIDFGCSFEGQIAGAYILKRAGGFLKNYDKGEYDFRTTGIIATNSRLEL